MYRVQPLRDFMNNYQISIQTVIIQYFYLEEDSILSQMLFISDY